MTDWRALDAAVAEAVFGWKHGDRDDIAPDYPDHFLVDVWWEPSDRFTFIPHGDVPRYSSDPIASKQLREKLAEWWPGSNLWRSPMNGNAERPFQYTLTPSMLTEPCVHGPYSDTEEHAVILCAAQAYGIAAPEVRA